MSSPVISVRELGKLYQLGTSRSHDSLRDQIAHGAKTFMRGMLTGNRTKCPKSKVDEFWALRDVSFDVEEGDVIGVIGRNGAGKSTLLKVLSEITEPTTGEVRVRGRVASLLEVGTGFHPELSGRENIYLNGAILGMSKAEITRKFDEIVDFSDVERFLDTPVKRYSSGMHMRLAFAVAAHLEPEILIVDEVLAVGDVAFQKKCLGKMQEVSSHGRTVLFVSHSMPTVLRLCKRVILLNRGRMEFDGSPEEATRKYLTTGADRASERVWNDAATAPGNAVARLHSIRVLNAAGAVSETIDISEPFEISVEYWNFDDSLKPTVSIHFTNEDGIVLFVVNDFNNPEWWTTPRKQGLVRSTCRVPANFVAEGRLFVLVALVTYNPQVMHAIEPNAVSFQAADQIDSLGTREKYGGCWPGVLRPNLPWNVQHLEESAALPVKSHTMSALSASDQ